MDRRPEGWQIQQLGRGGKKKLGKDCLHSASLLLHWRTERSNQSLKLLKKLEPFTTNSLIYCAYLLSTPFPSWVWNTGDLFLQKTQGSSFQKTIPAIHQKNPKNQNNKKPKTPTKPHKKRNEEINSNLYIMVQSTLLKLQSLKVYFITRVSLVKTYSWTDNWKVWFW